MGVELCSDSCRQVRAGRAEARAEGSLLDRTDLRASSASTSPPRTTVDSPLGLLSSAIYLISYMGRDCGTLCRWGWEPRWGDPTCAGGPGGDATRPAMNDVGCIVSSDLQTAAHGANHYSSYHPLYWFDIISLRSQLPSSRHAVSHLPRITTAIVTAYSTHLPRITTAIVTACSTSGGTSCRDSSSQGRPAHLL